MEKLKGFEDYKEEYIKSRIAAFRANDKDSEFLLDSEIMEQIPITEEDLLCIKELMERDLYHERYHLNEALEELDGYENIKNNPYNRSDVASENESDKSDLRSKINEYTFRSNFLQSEIDNNFNNEKRRR